MSKRTLIASLTAFALGVAVTAYAQGAAPSTAPPERMTGSTTMDNPATATTPPPGSVPATAPGLGTRPEAVPNADHNATHSDATSPTPGANSFTESQARSRMEDHGFVGISDLKLDDHGVWRGRATKDGKSVAVALDYQGDVVPQ